MIPRTTVAATLLFATSCTVLFGVGCRSTPYRNLLQTGPAGETIVFRDVTVFPATADVLLLRQDVVVRDGIIAEVKPTGVSVPRGATIVPGEGKTLLPGFVDAHVHLTSNGAAPWQDVDTDVEHNLHAFLYAGITTVFDLGCRPSECADWKEQVVTGEVLGPRIYHAGLPITVPGSHPIPLTEQLLGPPLSWFIDLVVPQITDTTDAEAVVREYVEDDVDFVKLVADQIPPGTPEMNRQELLTAIITANELEKPTFVHIGSSDNAVDAAVAGADVLAHGVWRDTITPEEAKQIADAGTRVIYTLAAWNRVADMVEGRFVPNPMDREISPDALFEGLVGDVTDEANEFPGLLAMAAEAAKYRPSYADNVLTMYEAGVTFLVGTDSPLPAVSIGGTYHDEMRLLHDAGIPAAEILLGATSRAARVVDPDPDFGTVEPGKVADLVLVDGNPVEDITATTRIKAVVVRGQWVRRIPYRSAGEEE